MPASTNMTMDTLTRDTKAVQPRLLSINQFMLYSGMGRNRATDFAKEHGWTVQFGRRVFVDKNAFDKYIDEATCS